MEAENMMHTVQYVQIFDTTTVHPLRSLLFIRFSYHSHCISLSFRISHQETNFPTRNPSEFAQFLCGLIYWQMKVLIRTFNMIYELAMRTINFTHPVIFVRVIEECILPSFRDFVQCASITLF